MPEGDTIFRAARTLQAALAGSVVTEFLTVFPQLARVDADTPVTGRTVESVVAAGKNLLMTFSGDLHLHTHMRMNGSWHIYRPGEAWRKRRSDMRIVIGTERWIAVAFNVPVAEFHDSRSLEREPGLSQIGPDLLGDSFDLDEAIRRISLRADDEIADVLLDQRVVAGIGNEYKSELLFMRRISPFAKAGTVAREELEALLNLSRKVMQANVRMRTAGRVTTGSLDPRERGWVYSRSGEPCRRCGTPIEFARQGKDARGTYWCPACQRT
ncbi:MAG: DNA-formamidopyrimidine glycosylase family protein [Thermoanaerobaculia bacterium]